MNFMQFCIFLFFDFLISIFCQSSFNKEYPGVNICQSGNLQDFSLHNPETRMRDINGFISNNCTHLQESLYIRRIIGMKDKTINLDSIREIDGHLIIEGNDVEKISLKNLVIIRGYASKTHTLVGVKEKINISLQVTGNINLKILDLSSLRSIYNHDILFDNNPQLTYLPHKIKWEELFNKPKVQRVHTSAIMPVTSTRDICSSRCSVWHNHNSSFCFGPLPSQCQMKTLCEKFSDECDICYYKNGKEINCCDQLCLGGCHKIGPENCVACKQMLDGKKCVETCPSRYTGGIAGSKQNQAFKYFSGSFCATKCPEYMLAEDTVCVHSCSDGHFKNESNHCIKCYGDKCKRHDLQCDLVKMTSGDERSFILSERILKNLTNCTKIRGYLLITKTTFTRNHVSVKMLYDHLSNVVELEGGFSYYLDDHLTNLTFLSKWKTFRQANLHIGSAAHNQFSIHETSLQFLGLKSLKQMTGRMSIGNNKDLCYVHLPWKEMGISSALIKPKKCIDEKCHSECSDKGCWRSGNDWCYECRHFEAGGQCVPSCSAVNGYFSFTTSSAATGNRTCAKCDKECAVSCNGTSPRHCIGGCVNKEENGVCVRECSVKSYLKPGTSQCLPCNKVCAATGKGPRCSGPSDVPGAGGCYKCQNILITRIHGPAPKEQIERCVSECPDKTFARASDSEQITKYFQRNGYVCEPCNPLCLKCTGRQPNKDDCNVCSGYWNGNICSKSCLKESTYGSTLINSSRVCLRCNYSCLNGCSGPTSLDCTTCRDRRVYINQTLFQCQRKCPADKNIEEMDKKTGQVVCYSVWDSPAKKDEIKRTKIVVCSIFIMLLFVILMIAGVVIFLRKKASSDRFETELKARYSNLTEPNSKDENAFSKPPNMGRLVIISIEDLIFEDESKPLGIGAFGQVFKGKWKVPKEDDMIIKKSTVDFYLPVAIKVIKNISNSDGEAIMQEAKIMSSVSHMHCLRFIGICLSYEKPCLVTSYVKEGSLDKFLVRSRSKITSLIMLSWAEQIADGMLYLTKRGIIHRDLAARNVLVSRLECVQITDFGLSKMLENTKEREIVIKSGKVPIRWLAIETLLEGKYSYETDVWAYGVTLWEIFTFGKVPYEDQATLDIADFVMKGGRLSQPEICSLDVYIVLVNCWLESPNLRPDFEALMKTFIDYCKNPGRYLSIQGDPFEIPSPSNIEMTNFNNPYGDHFNFSLGTSETMLPLLNGRDSIDVLSTNFSQSHDIVPTREEDESGGDVLTVSDNEDLPTRSTTKTSNIFKRFHEKSVPNNTTTHSGNHPQNSNNSNTSSRLVPLASLDQSTVNRSSIDEDPRYVADPTDRPIKLREIQPTLRTQMSETPRFHSNPLLKVNATLLYNLPPPPKSPDLTSDNDGYLEPTHNQKPPPKLQSSNDRNGYLDFSPKKKNNTQPDEYMTPSYNNRTQKSLNTNEMNSNGAFLTSARDNPRLLLINENKSPSNLFLPQNLIDDEYLEPQSKTSLIK